VTQLPLLAAFDLDGTLLDPAKRLTARTVAAVRALAARGCRCVLASGRMYRDCMAPQVARLGLDAPVIAYNGAMVLNPADGAIWYQMPLDPDLQAPLVAFAEEHALHLNLYLDDVLYCRRPTAWSDLFTARTGAKPVFRADLAQFFAGRASTKLIIIDQPATVEAMYAEWRAAIGDRLYVTISDPEYLEFMNPGATKGAALTALCARLGIDPARTVAFGDALNDLPLLAAAGTGYAMANARPEVRAAADAIAPGNDCEGVAQVIEGWLA
jgi:hypothetical protein